MGCDVDPAQLGLVDLLGAHANHLDAWLVAEGVEQSGELHALARLGVPLAQGFVFGQPGAGWAAVPDEFVAQLQAVALARAGGGISPLVQPWTVDLGPGGHPEWVHVGAGTRNRVSATAHPEESASVVARRALARDPSLRLDPVVVTGSTGLVLGVVTVEALLAELSRHPRGDTT